VTYGPHAHLHETSNPPSNYSTFARAQSLAMALEYGPTLAPLGSIPSDEAPWLTVFDGLDTAIVRTETVMASISAYSGGTRYPRDCVVRGGSIGALWFDGYGETGFLQVSSQTNYQIIEAIHMPLEQDPLPLTARIETTNGANFASQLDDQANLTATETPTGALVSTSGVLRDAAGASSNITFSWEYSFDESGFSKHVTITTPSGTPLSSVRIVEPFVDNPGNEYEIENGNTLRIATPSGRTLLVRISSASGAYSLQAGVDRERHWSPFPGFDGYPLVIQLDAPSSGSFDVTYAVTWEP
jgi:hypothetical protein